jgi:hypothetical protein
LFLGTQADNVRDCINKGRRCTRRGGKNRTDNKCSRGLHELTPENLCSQTGKKGRVCKLCYRDSMRRWRASRKEARLGDCHGC